MLETIFDSIALVSDNLTLQAHLYILQDTMAVDRLRDQPTNAAQDAQAAYAAQQAQQRIFTRRINLEGTSLNAVPATRQAETWERGPRTGEPLGVHYNPRGNRLELTPIVGTETIVLATSARVEPAPPLKQAANALKRGE